MLILPGNGFDNTSIMKNERTPFAQSLKACATIAATLLFSAGLLAESPDAFERGLLSNETLRIDYMFTGTDKTAEVSLCQMSRTDGWYGRRVNMDKVPVLGNGNITMRDASTGKILYTNSFSTLFQEWQTSEEASRIKKSFENSFFVPMPGVKAEVRITLFDLFNNEICSYTHIVDPSDILIRRSGQHPAMHKYLLRSGKSEEKIDIAFVSEGYSAKEMRTFFRDAANGMDALLEHEPFRSMKDRFNFVAIFIPSRDSGISIPHAGLWYDTAVGSSVDTFYSERYLTTLKIFKLHDALSGVPYEHLIILANTENYGGGGIYNSYTLTSAHHSTFRPVLVHEFGHSFGALGDEYYYDDQFVNYYYKGTEPWEQNLTTLADFESKWKDMISDTAQPFPTPLDWSEDAEHIGLYEGGGYMSRGVYRACVNCRMKTNEAPQFCPVCRRAISRIIDFNTVEAK